MIKTSIKIFILVLYVILKNNICTKKVIKNKSKLKRYIKLYIEFFFL